MENLPAMRAETSRGPALALLKDASAPGRRPDVGSDAAEDAGDGGRKLVCRACGLRITSERERATRDASHRHVFANPHGVVYDIALFAAAPGCRRVGPRSTEFAWFAGCSWQIAICGRCETHLGWHFAPDAGGAPFFGLIADRLAEAGDSP